MFLKLQAYFPERLLEILSLFLQKRIQYLPIVFQNGCYAGNLHLQLFINDLLISCNTYTKTSLSRLINLLLSGQTGWK